MARGEGAVRRFACAIHIIANGSSSSIWPHRMIRQPRRDKCGRHRVLLDQQPVGVVLDFTQPTSPGRRPARVPIGNLAAQLDLGDGNEPALVCIWGGACLMTPLDLKLPASFDLSLTLCWVAPFLDLLTFRTRRKIDRRRDLEVFLQAFS